MKGKEISPQLAFSKTKPGSLFSKMDGTMYGWVGTHWQCVEISELENEAMAYIAVNFPEKANAKLAASAASTAILLARELPKSTGTYVPTLSGYVQILNYSTKLIPASPKLGLSYVLNCHYDKNATCPLFDNFLKQALPDENVSEFWQEYVGYTLLNDARHQKGAWLIGEGGTGKSTVVQIIKAMHEKSIALSLDALDGFKLAGLQAASLVCVDETPTRINEQRLKTLVSGDVIQIDRKFRDPLTLRPTAKWIVNGNALPSISDHSTGFWRRWYIFPFNVKPNTIQPLLAETIIRNELSGILNWSLVGLNRLLLRGSFPVLPDAMVAAIQVGKQQSNTVAEWVDDDGIKYGENAKNTRSDVFACYSQWCRDSNVKSVGVQKFWERLRVIFPELPEDRHANRIMVGGKRRAIVQIYLP